MHTQWLNGFYKSSSSSLRILQLSVIRFDRQFCQSLVYWIARMTMTLTWRRHIVCLLASFAFCFTLRQRVQIGELYVLDEIRKIEWMYQVLWNYCVIWICDAFAFWNNRNRDETIIRKRKLSHLQLIYGHFICLTKASAVINNTDRPNTNIVLNWELISRSYIYFRHNNILAVFLCLFCDASGG